MLMQQYKGKGVRMENEGAREIFEAHAPVDQPKAPPERPDQTSRALDFDLAVLALPHRSGLAHYHRHPSSSSFFPSPSFSSFSILSTSHLPPSTLGSEQPPHLPHQLEQDPAVHQPEQDQQARRHGGADYAAHAAEGVEVRGDGGGGGGYDDGGDYYDAVWGFW